ncbi:MAG: hypothetical protein ABSG13_21295 [Bryobacteraceae bacterium]|jgi:hypothetical protein
MTDDELDQRVRASILSEELDTSRVAAAVRSQIQTQRRHVRGWAVAAAALIAMVLAAGFSYRTFRREQTPQLCVAAAQDHEREIVNGEPRQWLSDLTAIQSLGAKQGVPASAIAALGTTGYSLERGRLCFLKKQIYLHLVYVKDGTEYSVFLRPLTNEAPFGHSVREVSVGAEDSAYFQTTRLTAVFVAGHSHAAAAFARAGARVLQGLPS